MPKNFRLIVITSEKDVEGEINTIGHLFDMGLEFLHIRKPTYDLHKTEQLIESISKVFHPRIVLHHHYELIQRYNLKGAHLPEKIRKAGITNETQKIISTSFHKLDDILNEKMDFEYAFFSPVFRSVSKKGYEPSIKPEILNTFFQSNKNKMPFPIIALGGITDKNILETKEIGFSGAATIGYIWESPNPVEKFKKLQRILQV